MPVELPKYHKFEFVPKRLVSVVFKNAYFDNIAAYVQSIKNDGFKVGEVTEELFNQYKTNIFDISTNPFLSYDIIYIDVNKFGYNKTKLMLITLEQTLFDKNIIVFSTDKLTKFKLVYMEQIELDPFIKVKKSFIEPFVETIKDIYNSSKIKVDKVNKRLDEEKAKEQPKKVKREKKKATSEVVTKKPPLRKIIINLVFLFFFTLISSLSSFFAFSNTRANLYRSTINASLVTLNQDAKNDLVQAKRLNLNSYTDLLEVYGDEKYWSGDFITLLMFKSSFREKSSGITFNPILLPGDTVKSRNFTRFDYVLLDEEGFSEDLVDHTKVVLGADLVKSIFSLENDAPLEAYIGATFSSTYNFKEVNFVIENIIVDEGNYILDDYIPNQMIVFNKPTNIDNYSNSLVTFIRSNSDEFKSYLSHFYDNYSDIDLHEFSYISKEGQLVIDEFVLNKVTYELGQREDNYLVVVIFIIISLLLGFFALSTTLQLRKIYSHDIKELVVISTVPLVTFILLLAGLNINKGISSYSIGSFALINTFGIIFSLLLVMLLVGLTWFPKVKHFIEEKLNHN